jgi:DNA-binding NarL/FixJ family response regulator
MHDTKDSHLWDNHRMTIVLADADAHFRNRLKKRLEKITGVNVVGESSDSEETTAMILNRKPDIAILNSSLRDGCGIEVLRQIKRLMVPPTIIVVTDDPSHDNKSDCSLAGADFLFDKGTEDHKMVHTVRLLCVPHSQIEAPDSPIATRNE